MTEDVDYYKVMDLPRSCFESDMKKAFRAYSLRWHPDRSSDPMARERFGQVCAAFEVLGNERLRSAFDRYGGKGLTWEKWTPSSPFSVFDKFVEDFGGGTTARNYLGRPKVPSGTKPPDYDDTMAEFDELYPIQGFGSANKVQPDPWGGTTAIATKKLAAAPGLQPNTNKDRMMGEWLSKRKEVVPQRREPLHSLSNSFKDSITTQLGGTGSVSAKDAFLRGGRPTEKPAAPPGPIQSRTSIVTNPAPLSYRSTLSSLPEAPVPPAPGRDLNSLLGSANNIVTYNNTLGSGPASVKESMMRGWHSTGRGPATISEGPNVHELNSSFKSSLDPDCLSSSLDLSTLSPKRASPSANAVSAAGSLAYTRRSNAKAGGPASPFASPQAASIGLD